MSVLDRAGDALGLRREPEVIEQQGDGEDRGRGIGLLLARDVGRRSVHGLEHRGERAVGVDVPRSGETDASGDGAGQVGEDVAEEVVGDDHVEAARVRDQEDRRRVDVQVVYGDVGVLGCHRVHDALPHPARVHEHVRLVHERELLAAPLGLREGVAHDPLDAVRRVDGRLVGDLVRACRCGSTRRCRRTGPRFLRGRRRSRSRRARRAARAHPGRASTGAGSRSGPARSGASAAGRARCSRPSAAGRRARLRRRRAGWRRGP